MNRSKILLFIGAGVLIAALLGLVISGLGTITRGHPVGGDLPAASLVLLMVGLALVKPELLEDDTQQISSMRVVVLAIVGVFVMLTTKAGWSVDGLSSLSLDGSWAWVLGAALGGKALQSFGENFWPTVPNPMPAPVSPQPDPVAVSTTKIDSEPEPPKFRPSTSPPTPADPPAPGTA